GRLKSIGERTLTDGRDQLGMATGHLDRMASAKGAAPDRNAAAINLWTGLDEIERRIPIRQLTPYRHQLARHTATVAEITISEGQCRDTRRGEPLGIRIQPHFAHGTQTVSEHHHRRPLDPDRQIQPRGAERFAGAETNVAADEFIRSLCHGVYLIVRLLVKGK